MTQNNHRVWELTVNVLVLSADDSRILLIQRVKPPLVGWWLPPGGHVEPEETPDEAACREVEEESGLRVKLVDGRADMPLELDARARRVPQPHHIQLEPIDDRHNHLDLIYIARPVGEAPRVFDDSRVRWFAVQEALDSDLVPENTKVTLAHSMNKYGSRR